MMRWFEDHLRGPNLDQLAQIHHADPISEVSHYGEIVRNEEIRDILSDLQVSQKI
jgi:hypothetical protein